MAAGSKKGKGTRARARARRTSRTRPAVLGNDPFERGAAPREPASAGPEPVPARPRTRPEPPAAAPAAEAAPPPEARIGSRLADVERRLDSTLDAVEARVQDLAARAGLPGAPDELKQAVAGLLPVVKERLSSALDLVRLLEPAERLDRFGMDERFAERLAPLVELAYASWWRVEVREIERVPEAGPAIVVANHAGSAPWEAFVLRHALRRDHPARRDLRPLLDDAACDLPVIGTAAIRSGSVRAGPEAAEQLLRDGAVVAVFPEGSAVARKPWRSRYQILHFGRGGFVKLALRTGAPIVPCAIVGCEESVPRISRTGWLAERLGIPLLAASPSLRFAPAGLLPLPSRWSLRFGVPIEVREHGPEAASRPEIVEALAGRARAAVQGMLDEDVATRTSVYL